MLAIPLVATLALLSFQPANAAEDPWETITSESPPFSVAMPVRPKTLKQTVQTVKGPVEQSVLYAKVDGVLFTSQVLKLPEAALEGGPDAVLDRECRDFVRSNGGKVVYQKTLKFGAYPAWDAVLKGPAPGRAKGTVTSRHRSILVGSNLFTLTAMSKLNEELTKDAERFITSFKLAKTQPEPTVEPKPAGGTPEDALRAFLLAMATHDEQTLRAVTLPVADFEWLLKGQAVPPDKLNELRADFERNPIQIRRLKAGDKFTLPGNREITIPRGDVSADRAVLVPAGAPVPTRMRKVDGHWRVDARPIIDARKAADAVRRKAQRKAP